MDPGVAWPAGPQLLSGEPCRHAEVWFMSVVYMYPPSRRIELGPLHALLHRLMHAMVAVCQVQPAHGCDNVRDGKATVMVCYIS